MFVRLASPSSTAHRAEWAEGMGFVPWGKPPLDPESWSGNGRTRDLSVLIPATKVQDLVWTWYGELLVQDHVLNLLHSNGFTGFATKPVESRFKKTRTRPPLLHELVVTGWGGMASPDCGLRLIEYLPDVRYSKYGGLTDAAKIIDHTQWDGSDFFMVWPLPSYIFVTCRVIDALSKAGFKGYRSVEINEIASLSHDQTFGPGVLSNFMPLSVAQSRGEQSGIVTI